MRRLPILLLSLAGIAVPAVAARNITVEQLEQVLAAAHGKADAKVAQQLSGLELTERLARPGFRAGKQTCRAPIPGGLWCCWPM